MKVKLTQDVEAGEYGAEEMLPAGSVLEVDEATGAEMIEAGVAEVYAEEEVVEESKKIKEEVMKIEEKKVEVKGIVTQAADGKDLMDVKSIDLAEDESETDEVIQGEPKEYTSTDLGFKLTYLDNWTVKDGTAGVSFKAPQVVKKSSDDEDSDADEDEEAVDIEISKSEDVDEILITRLSNSEKKSLENFLNLPTDANELITSGYSEMKVGVDRLDGLKKQGSADSSEGPLPIDVYLTRGTYVYKISFLGVSNKDSIKNQNTYFSMVSSLSR